MNRVFNPLSKSHPLVTDVVICPVCREPFLEGQRPVLVAARESDRPETVPGIAVHATCSLQGLVIPGHGEIQRIKDGDASPYPVILTDGTEITLAEAGLE